MNFDKNNFTSQTNQQQIEYIQQLQEQYIQNINQYFESLKQLYVNKETLTNEIINQNQIDNINEKQTKLQNHQQNIDNYKNHLQLCEILKQNDHQLNEIQQTIKQFTESIKTDYLNETQTIGNKVNSEIERMIEIDILK